MKSHADNTRFLAPFMGAAALGAAAMYILDPDRGRRRRAVLRDKFKRSIGDAGDLARVSARDAGHRVQGIGAIVRRLFAPAAPTDDLVLIERVRARMGRVVSHPHAIQIGARAGRVVLSGPILASEAQRLVRAVRSVWGVIDVDDQLVVHERPESIPSLQGAGRRNAMRSEITRERWTPALRVASVLGGTALAVCAARQRGWPALALGVLAFGFGARGATNLPLSRVTGLSRGRRRIELQRSVHIAEEPETVYDVWTNCENFPRFMSHVRQVSEIGEGRTHWIANGPAGMELEWDALVTRAIRPALISWRTDRGALLQHSGVVHFEAVDGGTRVTVKTMYDVAGELARALASLLGNDPRRQMEDDLARMRTFIEHGTAPRDPVTVEGASNKPALH